jgi:hypothetical protein
MLANNNNNNNSTFQGGSDTDCDCIPSSVSIGLYVDCVW